MLVSASFLSQAACARWGLTIDHICNMMAVLTVTMLGGDKLSAIPSERKEGGQQKIYFGDLNLWEQNLPKSNEALVKANWAWEKEAECMRAYMIACGST